MIARSRSTSWRDWRTTSSTRCSTSTLTTSTIWLTARSTRSESTGRWRTRRGRSFPLFPATTLVLTSSRPNSTTTTTTSGTGLPSSTSSSRSSTGLDNSSRRGRARGYQHLRLVQLRQHLRLLGRQLLLPDSRLRHFLAPAITAASRGTMPTLAPGRRRQDNRGSQLSPGRQHRVG